MTKIPFSLLGLLAASLVSAQFDADRRDDRVKDRSFLEGRYEAYQLGRAIHRTLRLDRDGTAELVTEVRADRGMPDARGRDDDRGELRRFGRIAVQAAGGVPVRQVGRWSRQAGAITLRLDAGFRDDRGRDGASGDRARRRVEMTLVRREDGLVLDGEDALYGRDALVFRQDAGRYRDRGGRTRDGYAGGLRVDRELFDVDGYEYGEDRGEGRLVVRSGVRTYTLRGEARRRGDEVTLRLVGSEPGDRASGTLVVTLRDGRVLEVRGAGERGGHRYEFLGGRG